MILSACFALTLVSACLFFTLTNQLFRFNNASLTNQLIRPRPSTSGCPGEKPLATSESGNTQNRQMEESVTPSANGHEPTS
ncbi:hypothetical protein RRG08_004001 [Elysia crispata]|uniref:Uncharacterized protein n=1 Tax=Elysia crispata TaxID=231223 RepID=A0AAE1CSU4_9GAST|nr:hypothetical protein RRG08_004001 [Elysia crispata]